MNSVKEAAERLRKCDGLQIPWEHSQYARTDGQSPMMKWQYDVWQVAKMYLRAHDATPIDADWLRSVGFDVMTSGDWWEATMQHGNNELTVLQKNVFVTQGPDESIEVPAACESRGQLRRLCAALGIELREEQP